MSNDLMRYSEMLSSLHKVCVFLRRIQIRGLDSLQHKGLQFECMNEFTEARAGRFSYFCTVVLSPHMQGP